MMIGGIPNQFDFKSSLFYFIGHCVGSNHIDVARSWSPFWHKET